MDVPQYECADVPSEYFYDGMIYYTYHRHMDVHQYVCADVSSVQL
jgi:hypothetical protein